MKRKLKRKDLTDALSKYITDRNPNEMISNEMINKIKKLFSSHKFSRNKNYFVCGRREFLIEESMGIINNNEKYLIDVLRDNISLKNHFVLENIFELTYSDCYPYSYVNKKRQIVYGSEIGKLSGMDLKYNKKGIVSLQEKIDIENIINELEKMNNTFGSK